ncbi:MAG: CBS domain-containing protein [Anaerolineae bacterium]|nr:CBS domain-containing protein [Anaerolineae bacterium]
MHVILTHENADFDAIASLLGAHKLYPEALPILPDRINTNANAFISLYRSALPFITRSQWRRRKIEQVTLVDTQRSPSLKGTSAETRTHIIDHHPLTIEMQPDDRFEGDVTGANVTLLVEQIAGREILLSTLEATLLALGLYEDTGSFTYGRTTARDFQAGAWLVKHGADLDVVRRFLDVPLSDEQHALYELLMRNVEHRSVAGYTVAIATASVDSYISEISRVAHRISNTLEPAALFLLVATPKGIHLICRSSTDDIDVSEIAKSFHGGGHKRAAAATIGDGNLADLTASLWEMIQRVAQPAVRVSQLMSHGVQTVNAQSHVREVVQQLRRIGHEGYPVVENGQLVGLLTRRDADRASEHGLGDLRVRDIMQTGTTALTPDDSIYQLEQTMLQSGWGQIPVIGSNQRLIGIVTRTDLIKHWAQTHPPHAEVIPRVDEALVQRVLGENAAQVIRAVGELAQDRGQEVYMVGGCVRDLLLHRRNLDIDFVVEGDAVRFAEAISAALGGSTSSFRPFGTAKWFPDETTHDRLGLKYNGTPEHIDFASARNEFYEHPTALPTVYSGSIKLDLQRRDFTINALAVQISPSFGRILDYYGGLRDLELKHLRVLHSLSFIDDPTRIVRAVRFEQRLQFEIEPRTADLIPTALPMLGRITGERVRNELNLLLHEPQPEGGLLSLAKRGALSAIHPALRFDEKAADLFRRARATDAPNGLSIAFPDMYWHLLALSMTPEEAESMCERLRVPRPMQVSLPQTARLNDDLRRLIDENALPSAITRVLETCEVDALLAHYIRAEDDSPEREMIARFLADWRHVKPITDGHRLKAMGLEPGPCFKEILDRLRTARLDDTIKTDEDEMLLLQSLLGDGICDDDV